MSKKRKIPEIYVVITLNYEHMVFPYVEGMTLMDLLMCGEKLEGSAYDSSERISKDIKLPEMRLITEDEYKKIKMNTLLMEKADATVITEEPT